MWSKKIWCCHGSFPNNDDFFFKIKNFLKGEGQGSIFTCNENETQKIMWTDLIDGTQENSPSTRGVNNLICMNYSILEDYFSKLGLDFMIRGHQDNLFNTTFFHNHDQNKNFSIYEPDGLRVKHGTSLFDLLKELIKKEQVFLEQL